MSSEEFFKKQVLTCNDRYSPNSREPKNITRDVKEYFPFDTTFETYYVGSGLLGNVTTEYEIKSSKVYNSYDDAKRLVLEVGCSTVIYLQISPKNLDKHHKIFIQKHTGFIDDTQIRLLAKHVVDNTSFVLTIAKYEMWFLLGVFQTVSIPMWLAVTGVSALYMYADSKVKVNATNKLLDSLLEELDKIKPYAPVLHSKISMFIDNEEVNIVKHSGKKLPQIVAEDEAVRGQVVGIIIGKILMSPEVPSVWSLFTALMIQVAAKSVLKVPEALAHTIDNRYTGIVEGLKELDLDNPRDKQIAAEKISLIMKESYVSISNQEMQDIFNEVRNNPVKLSKSLERVAKSFQEFSRKMKN